ncbi:MAG TPA: helix-turn-helix transcriptional regulator [Gemmatimonas sp.]|nr:helix-turn-helix transcriptional regulator [Gemmatimonas sp.]
MEFGILLSLGEAERHGYGMIKDAAKRGIVRAPDVGTLYRALRRMTDQGLIVESDRRSAHDVDDERRQHYRITPLGRRVARGQALQFAALARAAVEGGLLEGGAL